MSELYGLFAHLSSCFLIEKDTRSFFNDLLIAPLDRTFTFVQIDNISLLVTDDLQRSHDRDAASRDRLT